MIYKVLAPSQVVGNGISGCHQQYADNFSTFFNLLLGPACQVDHMGSIFLLGGALMGAPPHHHGPALNSLVYGALGSRVSSVWWRRGSHGKTYAMGMVYLPI